MSKRRKNNEGYIRFIQSKKIYEGRIRIVGKSKYFYAKTQQEVQDKMFAFRTALRSGLDITVTSSLREVADKYLKVKSRILTPKTVHGYETQYRVHIDSALGSKKITAITPSQVFSFVDEMVSNNKSADSVNRTLKVLKAIFRHAQNNLLIINNPAENVDGVGKEEVEKRALDTAEIKAFVTEVKKDKWFPLWFLLLNIGCRIGEALAIEWSDIDWEKDILTISKTFEPKFGLKHSTKNKKIRKIMLNASTMKVLQEHHSKQLEQQLSLGKYWNPQDLVFANSVGEYLNYNNIRSRHFNEILKRAGISDFTIHGLRHTFASQCIMNKVPFPEISHFLGHKNTRVTMEVYSHFIEEYNNTSDVMEKIING